MSLLSRIKAAYSALRWNQSSTRIVEGMGHRGSKPRPFDLHAAARAFNSWLYAAADLNANAAAGVKRRLFVRKRAGAKSLYRTRPLDRVTWKHLNGYATTTPPESVRTKAVEFGSDIEEVIEPHPILLTLKTVNPWANGYELDVHKYLDLQISGNHYEHVVLDPSLDIPAELWRMPPQWTLIQPSRETFIKGFVYGQGSDIEREFAPDEVIQWKMPNPRDLYYGMGWYQAAWSARGLNDAKREMDTAKADNYARPDWLLSIKNGANKDTLDNLESKVNEKFRGTDKAGKFLVAGGDVSAVALNFDEKEWGTGTRVIEEIAAVSGVPVAMLLSNDPNRANSEASRLGWHRNTIHKYVALDTEKLNERWVPMFEEAEDVFICYDPVSFEDRAALVKEQVALVAGGLRTPNEGRAYLMDPESDDPAADQLYPPIGGAGVSSGAGDSSPGQNDSRRNEDAGVTNE